MDKNEILAFLNANPICFLATVDGDRPRARGMMLFRADESGLLFHSGKGKDMTAQIERNPNVEVCTLSQDGKTQVRVAGVAEWVTDLAVKQQMVAERPFLKSIVDQVGWDGLLVFRVTQGVATVWTMETNLAPKTYVNL